MITRLVSEATKREGMYLFERIILSNLDTTAFSLADINEDSADLTAQGKRKNPPWSMRHLRFLEDGGYITRSGMKGRSIVFSVLRDTSPPHGDELDDDDDEEESSPPDWLADLDS